MALTFYHTPRSTSSCTAAIIAELEHHLSKPLAKRITVSTKGDTRTPDYLANVNPNGQVPVIIHEGTAIWESVAIAMYLSETFGVNDADEKQALYPSLGPKRGEAMKWIVWANMKVVPAGQKLAAADRADSQLGEEEQKLAMQKAMEGVQQVLSILDGQLEGKQFLLGEQYCLADTHTWCFISWITRAFKGVSLEQVGRVKEWMARVGSRPALKDGLYDTA